MTYRLVIRKKAETQLTEIVDWYEKRLTGLGSELLICFDAVFFAVERNPLLFQVKYKNIRCALVPRFPYGVFYFIDGDKIVVVAIFHLSRSPKLWKK